MKRAIYDKFVGLKEFGESDTLKHSYEQTSQKKEEEV